MPGAGDYLLEKLGFKKPEQPKAISKKGKEIDDLLPVSPNAGRGMDALWRIQKQSPEKYYKGLPQNQKLPPRK